MWKALNHSILINEMKIMRSFSLRVVMNLYSKINFEVFYLTQFLMIFDKNKIIGCKLFITKL